MTDAVKALPKEQSEAPPQPAAEHSIGSFEETRIGDNAYGMISEAIAIIQCRAQDINTDLVYGAKYCAEHARDILGAGIDARDVQACEKASAPLAVAISVLEAAVHDNLDAALCGRLRLLEIAKSSLDDAIEEAQ